MNKKNNEKIIKLENVNNYEEEFKNEYFELLLKVLKNYRKKDFMYQYYFKVDEYNSYLKHIIETMFKINVTFENGEDGKIIQLFPLFPNVIIDKRKIKIDENDSIKYELNYEYTVTFIINHHAVDYMKDIISQIEDIKDTKK